MSQLYPIRVGLTFGIFWGAMMFIWASLIRQDNVLFQGISHYYIGCDHHTCKGRILCGVCGFLDGFTGGLLFSLIYNAIPLKK